MPHIHELFDFVVSVFIVCRGKILLIYHKKYQEWLPIGGHIELNEDPETALFREIREECGLKVKILADKPKIKHAGVKPILTPSYVDVHRTHGTHKHIAFVYFAKSHSDHVKLHEREHAEYGWFTPAELKSSKLRLTKSIQFYCREAFKKAGVLCLALLLLGPAAAHAEQARVLEVSGPVQLLKKEAGNWEALPESYILRKDDRLKTGPNAFAEIAFDSRLDQAARLSQNSYLVVEKEESGFYLKSGSLFVILEKPAKAASKIKIRTDYFYVRLNLGGCIVTANENSSVLKAFSESSLYARREAPDKWRPLREGFKATVRAEGEKHERMEFAEYAFWQNWTKKHYLNKDERAEKRMEKNFNL